MALRLLPYAREMHEIEKLKWYYLDEIFFYNLYSFLWIKNIIIYQDVYRTMLIITKDHSFEKPRAKAIFLYYSQ